MIKYVDIKDEVLERMINIELHTSTLYQRLFDDPDFALVYDDDIDKDDDDDDDEDDDENVCNWIDRADVKKYLDKIKYEFKLTFIESDVSIDEKRTYLRRHISHEYPDEIVNLFADKLDNQLIYAEKIFMKLQTISKEIRFEIQKIIDKYKKGE